MDTRKLIETGGTEEEFEAAMKTLAATIREAGECLLDLQNAVEMLRMANDPALAQSVGRESTVCMRRAMRR
ncbi:MAG TPA: hypothetical protein VGP22_11515 [Albitalea sp.]|nr:hypothetical protein [Albitalea sp.]